MARISRSKSADEDVSDEDRSTASKAFSSVGISLYNEKGQYKDINDTLDELAAKWDTLTDAQRNYIAEQAAGIRNINTFNALMATWKEAKQLAQDATTDTDYYESVQEKHMESMQGKLDSLKASTQGFWNELLDTGAINAGIDIINGLIQALEKLINVFSSIGSIFGNGPMGTLLGIGGTGIIGMNLISNIKSARKELEKPGLFGGFGEGFAATLSDLKSLGLSKDSGYASYGQAIADGFKQAQESGAGFFKSVASGAGTAIKSMSALTKAIVGISAAVAVISAVVAIFDHFTTSAKEAREVVSNANHEYETQMAQQKNTKETIDQYGAEWSKLSKGVDLSNNENISLTNDQYERFLELNNKIAEALPDTVSGYDAQGNAITNLKGKVSELNAEYEKTVQMQAEQRYQENKDTYMKNFKNETGEMSLWDQLKTSFSGSYSDMFGSEDIVNILKQMKGDNGFDVAKKALNTKGLSSSTLGKLRDELKEVLSIEGDISEADFSQLLKSGKIDSAIQKYQDNVDTAANNVKRSMQDYITSVTTGDGKYSDLNDNVISNVTKALMNSSNDQIKEFRDNGNLLEDTVNNWFNKLKGNTDAQDALNRIMGINDETSIEDVEKILKEDVATLSKALDLDENGVKELKIQLGVEGKQEVVDKLNEVYDAAEKRNNELSKESGNDKKSGNTQKDYDDFVAQRKKTAASPDTSFNDLYWGNVNQYVRDIIPVTNQVLQELQQKQLASAEDTVDSIGDYITTFSKSKKIGEGSDLEGQKIMFTPILPDGTILDQGTIDQYIENITKGASSKEDVMNADAKGMKIGDQYINGIIEDMTDVGEDKVNAALNDIFGKIDANQFSQNSGKLKNAVAKSLFDAFGITNTDSKKQITDYLSNQLSTVLEGATTTDEVKNAIKGSASEWMVEAQNIDKTVGQQKKQEKIYENEFKALKKINKQNKYDRDYKKKIGQFVKDNNIKTKDQLALLQQCIEKADTLGEAFQNYKENSFDVEVNAESLEELKSNLDKVKETIADINAARSSSAGSTGLSYEELEKVTEKYKDLKGYNYDRLFESTASGIHMNVAELEKLNAEYDRTEKAKYTDKLKEEQQAYADTCKQIAKANTLYEKQQLIQKKNSISDQIQKTNELLSAYEGLTNAVTKWQNAQSTTEEGAIYDSITSGYEKAEELWNKGLVGTNEFKSFTQMFSNTDLTGQGVESYINAWQSAQPRMKRWLSEGGEGVENFLYDIRALNKEWAQVDSKGNWDFSGMPDIKTLAKSLNVSESLLDSMFKKLHDYGADFNMSEITDNLRAVREEAKAANQEFGEFSKFGLGDHDLSQITSDAEQLQKMKDFKFDLSVSDPKVLDDQIETANKLRLALVNAYGEGSNQVQQFDKQLNYLLSYRGELTDIGNLVKDGSNLDLTFKTNKEDLDTVIEKLNTIKGFEKLEINMKMNGEDDIEKNLKTIEGKISIVKGTDGKVDFSKDGAYELLDVYSALLNEQNALNASQSKFNDIDVGSLKSGAQQDAVNYIKKYQQLAAEMNKGLSINKLFGEGTVDMSETESQFTDILGKIKNAGEDVQKVFRNLGIDVSKIDFSNLENTMNGLNGDINNVTKSEISGMGGDFTRNMEQAKKDFNNLENAAQKARDSMGEKFQLNLDADNLKDINQEIEKANQLAANTETNSNEGKALQTQLKYLQEKKKNMNGYLTELKQSAEEAGKALEDGLNINVNDEGSIDKEIAKGEDLVQQFGEDSEASQNLAKQLDYLKAKKEELHKADGSINLSLNYNDNEDRINTIVGNLHSIDKYKDLEINFDSTNVDSQIHDVEVELERLKDPETSRIDFTQSGATELMDTLIALVNKKHELNDNSHPFMNLDTSGLTGDMQSAMNNIQQLQTALNNLDLAQEVNKYDHSFDVSPYKKAAAEALQVIQNGTDGEQKVYTDLGVDVKDVKVDDSGELNEDAQQAVQKELNEVDCDVLVNAGFDVKNIDKLNEDVAKLNKNSKINLDINWQSEDPSYYKKQLDDLDETLDPLRDADGNIDIHTEGGEAAYNILTGLSQQMWSLNTDNNVALIVDTSQLDSNTAQVINDFDQIQTAANNLQTLLQAQKMGMNVDDSSIEAAKQSLQSAVDYFSTQHPDATATLNDDDIDLASKDLDALSSKLTSLPAADVAVQFKVPQDAIKVPVPDGTVSYDPDYSKCTDDSVPTLNGTVSYNYSWAFSSVNTHGPTLTGTVKYSADMSGVHKLQGTAHANGTAYANGTTGNWGAKKDETALVGEVAPELRVNSKTGMWELLGEHGAEFAHINKGDIIFNAKQTSELFKNGYVTSGFGRGRSFLNGTLGKLNSLFKVTGKAYDNGTNYRPSMSGTFHFTKNKNFYSNAKVDQGSTKAASKAAQAAEKAADDFKESIDFIEIMIDRLEREIDKLDTLASSAYRKFADRNQNLSDEFSKVTQEIELQQKAYDAYISKANSIGLDANYANKVRNGDLSIEDITDENLKNLIDEFQEWYEKAIDCKDAITELNEKLGDLVKQNFDNVNDEFSSQLEIIEHENNLLETQLDIIEGRGMFAGQAYYTSMMKNEEQYIEKLHDQYMALSEAKYAALDSGAVSEGSEAWLEMEKEINSVSEAYAEAKKQLIDYKNEAFEMRESIFEKGMEYFSDITDESNFLQDILRVGDNDVFVKKTGRLNDNGNAINSLHAMNYNAYMAQADKYKEKIAELNEEIAKDPTNTKLIDKRNEYIQQQREMIQNANEEKKSIHDLVEESYNKMLEVLQKLIDKRKDLLQSQKDLYDYEKNISEQAKNITDLKKQLASISNDDSEEAGAKKQQLSNDLKDAQADLEASEYDQWLSDQEKLLDTLYDQYESILNERLDNIDGLLQDSIDYANQNSDKVNTTITEASDKVGYTITEGMQSIWNSTDSGVGKILSEYSTNFLSSMNTVTEYLLYIFRKMGGKTKEDIEADRLRAEAEKKRQEELKRKQEEDKKKQQEAQQQKQNSIGNDTIAGIAAAIWCEGNSGWGNDPFRSGKLKEKIGEENARKVQDYINAHGYNGDLYRYWANNLGFNASKYHYNAFDTGGYTGTGEGFAMLHAKERVLNATQTKAFEQLVYSFLPQISEELGKLDNIKTNASAINGRGMNSKVENSIDLTLNLPNVTNGDDFVKTLQTDKAVQKIIRSFTIDEAMGKNSLRKFNIK